MPLDIHPSDWPEWMREPEVKHQRWFLCRIVGEVLALALVVCFATGALGKELSHPTKVPELFEQAIKFGGYEQKCLGRPGGCQMPAVLIATLEDDNIRGQFDPRHPNFVRVNTTSSAIPGTLAFNEVVIHEFVHYLQWLFGELGPQSGCADLYRIEEQAYKAGAAYLAQFGIVKDYSENLASVALMAALCMAAGG